MAPPPIRDFGRLALRKGVVTPPQLQAAFEKIEKSGSGIPFEADGLARVMVGEGWATRDQIETLYRELASKSAEPAPVPADSENVIGRYVLLNRVGHGGMGEVFRAWDEHLNRCVAIKFLLAAFSDDSARFKREAQIAAQLEHPNLVGVHEIGDHRGRLYIVMPWIEGTTLPNAPFPLRKKVEALRDAARAVHYAHGQGVLHRDIKPDNILVTDLGKPYVTDFGLAKIVREGMSLTQTGTALGTPAYAAPEQLMISDDSRKIAVDARTDVYALGATLYELLTGRPPYVGDDSIQVIASKMTDDPPPPSKLVADVPRDLETIAMRAMERVPAKRYASAEAFAADLERWLNHESIHARPQSVATRAWRKAQRTKISVAAAIGATLVAAAAIYFFLPRLHGPPQTVPMAPEPKWETLFEDKFDRAEPGPLWSRLLRGGASIHDGELCLRQAHIVFEPELHEDVRFEFTGRAMPDAERPVEMSAFTNGSTDKGLVDGYSFEFGILENLDNMIQRSREVAIRKQGTRLEKGRTYTVTCASFGGRTRLYIDGRVELELVDPLPLQGPQHRRVGFGSKCDHLHISRVKISLAPLAGIAARTNFARILLEAGRPDDAEKYLIEGWNSREPELSEPGTVAQVELKYRIFLTRDARQALEFAADYHARLDPKSKAASDAALGWIDEAVRGDFSGAPDGLELVLILYALGRDEAAKARASKLSGSATGEAKQFLASLVDGGPTPEIRSPSLRRAILYAEAARQKSKDLFAQAEGLSNATPTFELWPVPRLLAVRAGCRP